MSKPQYMSQILRANIPAMTADYMKKKKGLQSFLRSEIERTYITALREAVMLMVVCEKETEDRLKEKEA